MPKKNIFFKTQKKYKLLIFLLFIIFFFIISVIIQKNKKLFNINENDTAFYNIPEDKKGKIIPNTNFKVLNLNSTNNNNLIIDREFNFSIQLYSSSNYDNLIKKYNRYLNNQLFEEKDFSIMALIHAIGIDYLLLYKSFITRDIANNYCKKYLTFVDNCLIVNVKKIN